MLGRPEVGLARQLRGEEDDPFAETFGERLGALPGQTAEALPVLQQMADFGIGPQNPEQVEALVGGVEALSTATGPFSVAAGETVTKGTGSKLAGLLAELAVSIPESFGVGAAAKLTAGGLRAGLRGGAKRAAREVGEKFIPGVNTLEDFYHPAVKDLLTPDPDTVVKHVPEPTSTIRQAKKIKALIEAGDQPALIGPGGVDFGQLAEAAAVGHTPSFRIAAGMLGQSNDEINLAIRMFSQDAKGHFVSKELMSHLYTDYLEAAAKTPGRSVIQDIIGRPQVGPAAGIADPSVARQAVPPPQAVPAARKPPAGASERAKAWLAGASNKQFLAAAEGIKKGRPFAIPKSLQGEMDAGVRKAFRMAGLSDNQGKELLFRGLTPTQRVLLARQWDEVIKPLIKVDNKKAKELAVELAQEAEKLSADTITQAQNSIIQKIKGLDPKVGGVVGGVDSQKVIRALAGMDNEALHAVDDALDVIPPEQLPRFIKNLSKGRRFARGIEELRAATMLTRVGSHIRNIVTTGLNVGTQAGSTAVAGGVDALSTAVRRDILKNPNAQREIFAGEAIAQMAGWWKGLPTALRKFGSDARAVRELVDPHRVSAFGDKIGKATTLPFKALAAEDRWFFDRAFAGEMWRVAFRKAKREGAKNPMERAAKILEAESDKPTQLLRNALDKAKKTLEADFPIEEVPTVRRQFVREALREAGEMEIDDALELAERSIFTAREGRFVDRMLGDLDDWNRNLGGAISVVAPFRRTPANLMREAMRLSPVGFLTSIQRARQLQGQGLPSARMLSQELGRATLGTATLAAVWGMLQSGWIQLHPFNRGKSRAQRTTEGALGTLSDSVTVGGYSLPIDRLEPMGSLLLATARVHQRLTQPGEEETATGPLAFPQVLFDEFPKAMLNQTFLEDFADLVDASNDPDQMGRFAQRMGMSFVPGIPQEAHRVVDPKARAPVRGEGAIGEFVAGVKQAAGIEKGLPRLGLFGMEQDIGGIGSIPFSRVGRIKNDPLVEHMLRIGSVHEPPKTAISVKGETLELSEQEKFVLAKSKGLYQRERLTRVFNRPGYKRLPVERQRKLLDNEFRKAGSIINKRFINLRKRGRVNHRDLLKGLMG
jgi:hypothetical protein